MTDPFYMLLLMHRLDARYLVWNKAGRIDYVEPGRGTVRAQFLMPAERIAEIEAQAAGGDKVLPEFAVDVVHPEDGSIVARVHKTLYVPLKPSYRPAAQGSEQ